MAKECGKILWESKNTKEFQKGWVEKLKKDQQEAGADVAVIENVAGIYGSVEGLVGGQKALPEIGSLSLEAIAGEGEE